MGGVLFSGSAAATMPEASAKRPFDHPADEAAAVFKPFIAQSRVQLFYVAEVIAVQGKPAETGLGSGKGAATSFLRSMITRRLQRGPEGVVAQRG